MRWWQLKCRKVNRLLGLVGNYKQVTIRASLDAKRQVGFTPCPTLRYEHCGYSSLTLQ